MVARKDCFVVLHYKYRILKNIFQMLLEIFALLLKVLLCMKWKKGNQSLNNILNLCCKTNLTNWTFSLSTNSALRNQWAQESLLCNATSVFNNVLKFIWLISGIMGPKYRLAYALHWSWSVCAWWSIWTNSIPAWEMDT